MFSNYVHIDRTRINGKIRTIKIIIIALHILHFHFLNVCASKTSWDIIITMFDSLKKYRIHPSFLSI